ncbi:hypothetical protein LX36DRAFT_643832 [Colletotrichum falcatum]|nr:hypothetical protein LX36DRAFT_643832 [Colletotrichum falcatum]
MMDKQGQPATPVGFQHRRGASSVNKEVSRRPPPEYYQDIQHPLSQIPPANAAEGRLAASEAPQAITSRSRPGHGPPPGGPADGVAARGVPSPYGLLHSQTSAAPFTNAEFAIIEALRSQPLPGTSTPLSQHSLTSLAGPLTGIASPKNTLFTHRSYSEKATGLRPSSTAPAVGAAAAAEEKGAYRPVTKIPCQDPGSRYRPGRISRDCEQRDFPDRHPVFTQAGSEEYMIAGPSMSGDAKRTPMDTLTPPDRRPIAREVVLLAMDRRRLAPEATTAVQRRNMLREKRSTGQQLPTYREGFSPGTAKRLSEGLVSRVMTESPKDKDATSRPQAAQETPGGKPLKEEADLKTQMDYFLYFNNPMVGTSQPPWHLLSHAERNLTHL